MNKLNPLMNHYILNHNNNNYNNKQVYFNQNNTNDYWKSIYIDYSFIFNKKI